jgi:hypothetical protein
MAVTPHENLVFRMINLRMNGGLLEIFLLEEVPVAVLHVVPVLVHGAVLLPRMGRLRSKMCQILAFFFLLIRNMEKGKHRDEERAERLLSAADPDPYVFGPPGSGSISARYGSGPDPAPDLSIIMQK